MDAVIQLVVSQVRPVALGVMPSQGKNSNKDVLVTPEWTQPSEHDCERQDGATHAEWELGTRVLMCGSSPVLRMLAHWSALPLGGDLSARPLSVTSNALGDSLCVELSWGLEHGEIGVFVELCHACAQDTSHVVTFFPVLLKDEIRVMSGFDADDPACVKQPVTIGSGSGKHFFPLGQGAGLAALFPNRMMPALSGEAQLDSFFVCVDVTR
jgi:hypothetical protein